MNIMKNTNGNTVIMTLSGRIDSITSTQLSKEIEAIFQKGDFNIVFDFSGIDYISSAGLRVLLAAQKKANAQGTKMKITSATSLVKEIFDMTGFSGIIEME